MDNNVGSEKKTTITQERQCSVYCEARKVKHDACMNDLFWGRNSNLSLKPVDPVHTCIRVV